MGVRLKFRTRADHDQEMTDGRINNLIPVSRGGPGEIAAKALTAEAAWHDAETTAEELKTAAGTAPASSAVTCSENKLICKK